MLDASYISPHAFGIVYGGHRDFLEFGEKEWTELKQYADSLGIAFTGSGWDEESVDFLDNLGVPFFKVPSADLLNFPLLKHAAAKGKPVIISTGMASLDDVQRAVAFLKQHTKDIILLHCTSTYPTKPEYINLRVIQTFKHLFPDVVIGYSGHENGVAISEAAAVLGAKVIERHFTLDRTMKGGDHAASLEPRGFMELVDRTRKIEKALGNGIKSVMPGEEAVKTKLAKSVVAKNKIPAGTVITRDMLCFKSPGNGVSPCDVDMFIGKLLKREVEEDGMLLPDDVGLS